MKRLLAMSIAAALIAASAHDLPPSPDSLNGRRVERGEKTYGAEFGYKAPVKEVYLVQHPGRLARL